MMKVLSAFLGDRKNERLAFMADKANYYLGLEKKVILLASDADTLGILKEAEVLAPGHAEDFAVDFAQDVMVAIGNVNVAARDLAKALVPDDVISNANEPFWETSAKMCIEAIIKTAAHAEAFIRSNTQPPYMSLAGRITTIHSEMAEKVYASLEKEKWWEEYLPDQTIETMIFSNAKRTASCMLSVVQSYLEPLCRISSSERTAPVNDNKRPLAIYAPAYDIVELKLVLKLLSAIYPKDSVLLVPEADNYKEAVENTSWDVVFSSCRPVADSDSVVFGFSRHSLLYFVNMTKETTGFERLTNLAYERPDVLTYGKGIAWELGEWHIVDLPYDAVSPRNLVANSRELDETVAALIAPTPKDVKGKEFDPEPFLHDDDEFCDLDQLLANGDYQLLADDD